MTIWADGFSEESARRGVAVYCDHREPPVSVQSVVQLVERVLEGEGRRAAYLGIILTGQGEVRRLNQRYRRADYDTDVLSFTLGDGADVDGEVYVNVDFASEYNCTCGVTARDEVCRYVVHGVLHLLGYRDGDPEGLQQMRRKEKYYLETRQQITR